MIAFTLGPEYTFSHSATMRYLEKAGIDAEIKFLTPVNRTEGIIEESNKEIKSTNPIQTASTIGNILLSIVKMATWSFGSLPILVEVIIFVPIRLIFYFIATRNILGSGG